MNATLNAGKRTESAHPLFPGNQVFLWLPGFTGNERPYCTYNEFQEHTATFDQRRLDLHPKEDENGAPYIPPFPVSSETNISWHTNVTPLAHIIRSLWRTRFQGSNWRTWAAASCA